MPKPIPSKVHIDTSSRAIASLCRNCNFWYNVIPKMQSTVQQAMLMRAYISPPDSKS